MMRKQSARCLNLKLMRLVALAVAACLSLVLASLAAPQVKKPISKKGLLEAIRLNGLSTRELIQHIEQRGVNFQLTAEDEAEFRAAGARPEVIAAVRANYRPAETKVNSSHTSDGANRSKPVTNVPPGPPLSKNEIITLLQSGVSAARVEQFVAARGVSFTLTPESAREINAAGGTPSLLSAIKSKAFTAHDASETKGWLGIGFEPLTPQLAASLGLPRGSGVIVKLVEPAGPAAQAGVWPGDVIAAFNGAPVSANGLPQQIANTRPGTTAALTIIRHGRRQQLLATIAARPAEGDAPDYDDLTDQATAALQANNPQLAVELLQQAIRLDSSQPSAFALLGLAQLYGFQDIYAAEQSMRAAIERGGGAVFRVYHDHNGFFRQYCQGSFFVAKTGVTFRADDGQHTFEAHDGEIEEVKLNGFVGSELGAFHLKVRQEQGKAKNYNFAPLTQQRVESLLIMNLIKSY